MGDHIITRDPDDPIDRAVLEFQQGIRRQENFDRIVGRFYKPVRSQRRFRLLFEALTT